MDLRQNNNIIAFRAAGGSVIGFFLAASWARAQTVTIDNPTTFTNFADFVEAILNIVLDIGIPVAAIFIIYSGFLFVTAQGNETKLEEAKNAFKWTVIGTAILLGAWVIAVAITDIVTSL